MVSKNNRIKRMEEAAERQSHFGIRKLTVGAASVLLGTTLWLGNNANVAHADTDSNNGNATDETQDSTHKATVNTTTAKKAVVVANPTTKNDSNEVSDENNTISAETASQAEKNNQKAEVAQDTTQSSAKQTEAKTSAQKTTTQKAETQTTQNKKAESSTQTAQQVQVKKAEANTAQKQAQQTTAQKAAQSTAAKINEAAQAGKKSTDKTADTVTLSTSDLKDMQSADLSSLSESKLASANALEEAKGNQEDEQVDSKTAANKVENTEFSATQLALLNAANENLQKQLGASLVAETGDSPVVSGSDQDPSVNQNTLVKEATADATSGLDTIANGVNEALDKTVDTSSFKTVTSSSELQSAIFSGADGVNVKGNISAPLLGGYTITKDFYINGLDGATINLGSNAINNTGNLTLANVTVNGSIKGGTVIAKGKVVSNVDAMNSNTLTKDELKAQTGTTGSGISTSNWKSANIYAQRVIVAPEASLTVNRSITGDGIALTGGSAMMNKGSVKDSAEFGGVTAPTSSNGTVAVGYNGNLTINLKDAQTASRSNEDATNIDNASSGIRATDNGHLITGDSATVTINAGHGRAVNFGEPFGGTGSIQQTGNLETNWYNNRSTTRGADYATGSNNSVILSDSTQMNITGRDGLVLGNRSSFVTGDHSVVHIDTKGNGSALTGDAFARVIVSPQSKLLITSDGKDHSGQWSGANPIGLGENGQFIVDHDATFQYKMTNRGGTPGPSHYDDNMNIISTNSSSKPLVYVGNNAVFDGQSDYKDYYGEIFAFPLGGSTNGVFQIDGAKYVNWQKTADVYAHSNHGNLYYSMGKSLIDATSKDGQSYFVFKWNNKDYNGAQLTFDDSTPDTVKSSIDGFKTTSNEYWQNVTHLATKYSKNGNTAEFPGHYVDSISMNGDATPGVKTGTKLNDTSDGFNPESAQRLVLVATTIPVQEDETKQEKTPYNVIVKFNKELAPGQSKVVQQGKDGVTRTTTTTYYTVDAASGKKTLDTTRGTNGTSTAIKEVSKEQDEIIEVGPQSATVQYIDKDTASEPDKDGKGGSDGTLLYTSTIESDAPYVTGDDGTLTFKATGQKDADGNETYELQANPITKKTFDKTIGEVTKQKTEHQGGFLGIGGKDVQVPYTVIDVTDAKVTDAGGTDKTSDFTNETGDTLVDKVITKLTTGDDPYKLAENGFDESHSFDNTVKGDSTKVITLDDIKKAFAITSTDNNYGESQPEGYSKDDLFESVGPTIKVYFTKGKKQEQGNLVVKYHDTTSNVDLPDYSYTSPTSKVGDKTNYSPTDTINKLEDLGYEPDGTIPTIPDTYTKGTQTVVINVKHGYRPVDPDNPIDKDNPIDPSHPDNPVNKTTPDGYTKTDLQKTVNRTIEYLEEDKDGNKTENQLADPIKQSVTFTGEGFVDKVTGNIVTVDGDDGKGNGTITSQNGTINWTYKDSDNNQAQGTNYTFQTTPEKETITKDGKTYSFDTTDPKDYYNGKGSVSEWKVTKDQNVDQTVKNYYKQNFKKGTIEVVFHDTTTDQDLPGYGSPKSEEDEGTPFTYTPDKDLTTLEGLGYVPDGDHDPIPTEYEPGDKRIVIPVKHAVREVTPDNPLDPDNPVDPDHKDTNPNNKKSYDYTPENLTKTVKRTFEYQFTDKSSHPEVKEDPQSVEFKGTGYVDKVTGNLVNVDANGDVKDQNGKITWSPDEGTLDAVDPKTVAGYHVTAAVNADSSTGAVPTKTVTKDDSDIHVVVVYSPDEKPQPGEQTSSLKIVDVNDPSKSVTLANFSDNGKPDTQISFQGSDTTLSTLLNNGYVFKDAFNDQTKASIGTSSTDLTYPKFDNDDNAAQSFTIELTHDIEEKDEKATSTGHVHYVIDDDSLTDLQKQAKTPADSPTQTLNWTRKTAVDQVTGDVVKTGDWTPDKDNYDSVDNPVVDGYTTKDRVASFTNEKPEPNKDTVVNVTYVPNGHVIPVDQNGAEIPNAPQPQFETDPNDPTKTLDNKKPEVQGYSPETGNPGDPVEPDSDPTQDVDVPYVRGVQKAVVNYYDQDEKGTDGKYKQLATSGEIKGEPLSTIDYSTADTIQDLENKGYVLVTNGFDPQGQTQEFDDIEGNVQEFDVYLKHGLQPVNPDNPGDPGKPINPNDPDGGPTYPDGTAKKDIVKDFTRTIHYEGAGANTPDDVKQNLEFTASGVLDKVTGKYVNLDANGNIKDENGQLTWDKTKQDVPSVKTTIFNDYHVVNVDKDTTDGINVDGKTISKDTDSYKVTVVYAPNGKIIPVDKSTGKPIPGIPTPTYPTNTDDPKNVQPNEGTPTIPGYHFSNDQPDKGVDPKTKTVTPVDPSKDTDVYYEKDNPAQVTIGVTYYDDTAGQGKQDLSSYNKSFTQDPGSALDYTTQPSITELENKGYKLVSDGFTAANLGGKMPSADQNYEVHLIHTTTPVDPDHPGNPGDKLNPKDPDPNDPKMPDGTTKKEIDKTVTRTVHYEVTGIEKGQEVTVPKDVTEPVHFTASGVLDNVTGKWIDPKDSTKQTDDITKGMTWTPDQSVPAVTSPTIDKFHVTTITQPDKDGKVVESPDKDGDNVKSVTLKHGDKDYTVTVTYAPNDTNLENKQNIPSKQTVSYLEYGTNKELSPQKVQNYEFDYSGNLVDAKTGNIITQGKWNSTSHTYGTEDVPVIDGYVAVSGYTKDDSGKIVAGGKTASIDNPDVAATVYYKKIGNIIPVKDDGKTPLPDPQNPGKNVPDKPYVNDPDDPTKVTPNEKVPDVPGYTPSTPSVTPSDPTKDTPVPYTKNPDVQVTVKVNYIDDTTKSELTSYDKVITGKPGDTNDYSTQSSIDELKQKGYDLVSDGYTDAKLNNKLPDKDQTYEVHVVHTYSPVNEDHPHDGIDPSTYVKNVKETVHYQGAGDKTPKDNVQNSKWTKTVTIDNVTNQIVPGGKYDADWSIPEGSKKDYDEVKSPEVEGYKAVPETVAKTAVTQNDIDKFVVYVPNGSKYEIGNQTVHYVDDQGNDLIDPAINDEHAFIQNTDTGKWDSDSYTYKDATAPVITGYVTDSKTAKGKTVTPDKPNADITIVYHKIGKIVPVDKNGKEIPDAPTPDYVNDPTDPTKVKTPENTPIVPGYTISPDQPNKDVDPTKGTVTPSDPTKDTPVQYENNDNTQKATVIYQDVNDPSNIQKLADSGVLSGQPGDTIDYSTSDEISTLEKEGYVLVNDGFSNGSKKFDNDKDTDQTYYVNFKHGITPIDPSNPGTPDKPINPEDPRDPQDQSKYPADSDKVTDDVTRTVTYQGAGDKTPAAVKDTLHFEAKGYVDKVTGKWVDAQGNEIPNGEDGLTWTSDDGTSFAGVHTPFINGYHIKSVSDHGTASGDVDKISGITHGSDDINIVVNYEPNGKIVPVDEKGNKIPNAPTPQYPTDPTDPKNVTPDEPIPTVPGYTPKDPSPITPSDPGKDTPVVYTKNTPEDNTQQAVVIFRDVNDPNSDPVQITTSGSLTGQPGDTITYDAQPEIDTLIKQGYVLKNNGYPTGSSFDNVKNNVQTFYIDFVHGTVPVDPTDPGTPGQPVNPDNPDGPKYPDGTDDKSLTKTVTRTIHYQGAGDNTPKDVTQPVTFTQKGVLDKVNGNWITPLTWDKSSEDVTGQNSPVITGYHVTGVDKDSKDNTNVDPATIKNSDKDYTVTVTYAPNGHIVPVLPDGKTPVPDVPEQPAYPNDPTDPSKVTPNEPIPTIPGYTPKDPSPITPSDPGKNTPVVYVPVDNTQHAQVIYQDINDPANVQQLATSGDLTGQPGAKIDYSTSDEITALTNKGYVLVNDGFTNGIFDNDKSTNQTYYVTFKHGTTTVTPDKPGTPGQPVDPDNPDGPKYPDGTDINSLKKTGTQTIHYVISDGKTKAPADNKQSFDFTKKVTFDNVTGKITDNGEWNVTSHTFGNVDTPVVENYHADKRNAGGTTVTPDDLTKEVTVTYTPNGHIVPVDTDGNPIPDVPTPQYPTDPTDPTKVTPDEPVPNVPGETPETPTVTPKNPGEDTKVVYTKPVAKEGVVNVYVHDTTTGQNLDNYAYSTDTQKVGYKVGFDKNATITDLTNKGYKVVNPDVEIPAEVTEGTQNVTIYVVHDTVPVDPTNPGTPGEPINPNDPNGPKYPDGTDQQSLSKTVTRTIEFVDNNGKTVAQTITQPVKFTAQGVLDKVTGEWTKDLTWSPAQDVTGTNAPYVSGYHVTNIDKDADGNTAVKTVTLTHDDSSYTVKVTYEPNGKIVPVDPNGNPIPNASTPQYPTDPSDPSSVTPDEPVPGVPGYTPSVPSVTPTDPGKDTPVVYNPIPAEKGQIVVTVYDDTAKTDLPSYGKDSGAQDVGTKFDFDKDTTFTDLENHGYKIVNPDVTIPTEITKGPQQVTIHVVHDTVPVDPTNPGKPGQPINPNDPDGPKYPDGSDVVTKDVTRTINYVDNNGKQIGKPVTQTTHFTGSGVLDKVTGQWTTPLTWTGDGKLDGANTPVIDGYHVTKVSRDSKDNVNVDPTTVTKDTDNYSVDVVYTPNGKIVPVDPKGNPIKGADTPTYKTDPNDPSKVVPDEKVPEITGRTPQQTTVTPQDPGKDTPVIYTEQGTVNVIVHDQTTDTNLDDYGYTSGTLDEGSKVNYDWATKKKDLEDKGYVIVTQNVSIPATVGNTTQTITIEVKHGTAPVNPDNPGKPGEPINPNDPNGPKWPTDSSDVTKDVTRTVTFVDDSGKEVHEPVTQTTHFTASGVIDKVTGKYITPLTWTKDQDVDDVKVPVVQGYHVTNIDKDADGLTNVKGVTLSHTDDSYTVKVTYDENGKIIPVDSQGNKIPNADTPTYPTDPNDPSKVTSDEPVPTVDGYTPSVDTVTPKNPGKDTEVVYTQPTPTPTPQPTVTTVTGKQTITFVDGDNNNTPLRDADVQTHDFTITNGVPSENSYTFGTVNVPVIDGYVATVTTAGGKTVTPDNPDANVTVVYHKIGKIVPVDKDHNPIPGVDTPSYKNDPNDPTKVVPDEAVPTVDGYTPSQETVTPVDPTKDTEVVYTKNEEPEPDDDTPDEPDEPTPTPKKHHKKTPAPKPSKPTPKKTNWSTNNAPHAQSGYWNNNVAPHGQSVNGWSNNIGPHGETVDANGNIVAPDGEIIGYVDANGNPHYTKTLPQTGSNDKQSEIAAALGATAMGLSMIGLAGVKKRRKRN